jgi:phosphate-selective porin OprO/OprP
LLSARRTPRGGSTVRTPLVPLLAASLAVSALAPAPAGAATDLERLEALEQEVALLRRKLEVKDEEEAAKASRTPIVGAGADGFFLRSPDQSFQLKLRAYTQADGRWLLDPGQEGDDTFLLRRVRLSFEGTVGKYVDFRIMPDFANSTLTLFDAYANLKYFPEAQVQVGKFKPPVGLERLQSATALTFVERAFPTLLVPSRDVGGMVWSELAEGLVTYQLGYFNGVRDGGTQDVDTDDGKDFAARLFFHPFRPLGSEWLDGFGIGVAGTWGRVDEQSPTSFRTTAAATSFFAYRGASATFAAVSGDGERLRYSPQAYWYAGPLGVMAEYVSSSQEMQRDPVAPGSTLREDLEHEAWQVAVSYALTGENASYKGLIPASPFAPGEGGWGAFEIAARYNAIDFDDDSFDGGANSFADPTLSATKAQGFTVGLNWYLNRWIKVMVNYDRTSFDGGAPGGAPGSIRDRETEDSVFTRLQLNY